jgi:hypothetical protein
MIILCRDAQFAMKIGRPLRAVKRTPRSQSNDGFRPDSGRSRGDPCRCAFRPKGEVPVSSIGSLSNARRFPPNVHRTLVLPQPDINCVPQEVVGRPGQIGGLGDKVWLDSMNARQSKRRPKARAARRPHTQGRCLAREGVKAAPQISEHLDGHPGAHTTGIDELAVIRVIAPRDGGRDPSGSGQPTITNSWRFNALALRQRPRFPGA